jgi:hypothetical protein
LLVTADVFTALVESLPDNVCEPLQVLLADICRCVHLQKKARAMVRWDAGFMLSNGRPLLDFVRKAKIERPRFRRGVARSLQHLMFLLSCGVTVSPPVPEALFSVG